MFSILKKTIIRKKDKYSGSPKAKGHKNIFFSSKIDDSNLSRFTDLLEITVRKQLENDDQPDHHQPLQILDNEEVNALVEKFMTGRISKTDFEQHTVSVLWSMLVHVIKQCDPVFSYDNSTAIATADETAVESIIEKLPLCHLQLIGALLCAAEVVIKADKSSASASGPSGQSEEGSPRPPRSSNEEVIRSLANVLFWSLPPDSTGNIIYMVRFVDQIECCNVAS